MSSVIILVIKQIRLDPLRGRPILLITRMITDRIGLRALCPVTITYCLLLLLLLLGLLIFILILLLILEMK